ncbi:hypothetical protein SLE2022_234400 [Rubroshorea leprosula]
MWWFDGVVEMFTGFGKRRSERDREDSLRFSCWRKERLMYARSERWNHEPMDERVNNGPHDFSIALSANGLKLQ